MRWPKGTGARVQAARKGRNWTQSMLAEKASVGGINFQGRTKIVQRLERTDIASHDVFTKVLNVLEFPEAEKTALLKTTSAEAPAAVGARRRAKKPTLVVDGQICVAALMALGWEGWRFVSLNLPKDVSDEDAVDDALIKVAGVVDVFREIGARYDAALKASFQPREPDKEPEPPLKPPSAVKQIEFARDIRKAATTLRDHGLDLWLNESWLHEEGSEWFFTRKFSVARRGAVTGDNEEGAVE